MRPFKSIAKSIAAAISLGTAALVTAQAPLPDAARVVEAAKFNAKIDPKTFATTK
jgi:hypothetical protein